MHFFGPYSNDRIPLVQPSTPWGFDPKGRPVTAFEQLPEMPVLELVVIGADHLEINGWIFPYNRLNKGILQWLQGTLVVWSKSDPDPNHRQWIEELVDTFQQRLGGTF